MVNHTRSVLHVDDDPHAIRIVAELLKKRGYGVVSVSDPATVLARLLCGTCRVVLLGIDMSAESGCDLLRAIKRQDGAIQVIVLTEPVPISTAIEWMRLGAEACIIKPLTDVEPLGRATDTAFEKIDHWWAAVRELSQRKSASRPLAVPQRTCASQLGGQTVSER